MIKYCGLNVETICKKEDFREMANKLIDYKQNLVKIFEPFLELLITFRGDKFPKNLEIISQHKKDSTK